jgi:hypothetical protein
VRVDVYFVWNIPFELLAVLETAVYSGVKPYYVDAKGQKSNFYRYGYEWGKHCLKDRDITSKWAWNGIVG